MEAYSSTIQGAPDKRRMRANMLTRWGALAAAACLALSLCACSGAGTQTPQEPQEPQEPSAAAADETVQETPTVYPSIAESYYLDDDIAAPPETIYTTAAEENGLDGTVYRLVGR